MRKISVIGIATGNPEHLTLEAVKALGAADVLFIPVKGQEKTQLADVRRDIVKRHVTRPAARIIEFDMPRRAAEPAYRDGVDRWHGALAEVHERLFLDHLGEDQTGAFLVWGDPMLYDSTIRILERVLARGRVGFAFTVLPGLTSLQLLTARHRIPVNLVGRPVTITTGRRLADDVFHEAGTTVVMLDGEQAFLRMTDPEVEIFWGAYLGLPQEMAISGRLADVRDEIVETRRRARAEHGWIMDIYLLRKGRDFDG